MNKTDVVDVTTRRYVNPQNILSVLTDKLNQQSFGPTDEEEDFDPSGVEGGDIARSVPAETISPEADWTPDSIETGITVEETLTRNANSFFTSQPFLFFRDVWFDGIIAFPQEHWTLSGSDQLIPNVTLISGTEVIGKYVIGYE